MKSSILLQNTTAKNTVLYGPSSASCLLMAGFEGWNPFKFMDIVCCIESGLYDELITRKEESSRVCVCVYV